MHSVRLGAALFLIATAFIAATASANSWPDDVDTQQLEYAEPAQRTSHQAAQLENAKIFRDVAYGRDKSQNLDVYAPERAQHAPVIFMVHGGAWMIGNKNNSRVVDNKIARWVSQGFIFISINYRMLPQLDGLQQADDVARALAFAQAHATDWGGDPEQFIVMGHSAGAHLVALLTAAPEKAYAFGAKPWLGTVSLDSAALDVVAVMQRKHMRFYDKAFGSNPSTWEQASPLQHLSKNSLPMLAVCSTQRRDKPCDAAKAFKEKAELLNVRVEILPQDLSHGQINEKLGLAGSYTSSVETFMASLDNTIAKQLRQ